MNSSCWSNCEPSAHTALGAEPLMNTGSDRCLIPSKVVLSVPLSLYYLIIAKPPVLLTSRLCFARFGGGSPTEVFVFCNYRRNACWTEMALSSLPFFVFLLFSFSSSATLSGFCRLFISFFSVFPLLFLSFSVFPLSFQFFLFFFSSFSRWQHVVAGHASSFCRTFSRSNYCRHFAFLLSDKTKHKRWRKMRRYIKQFRVLLPSWGCPIMIRPLARHGICQKFP